MGRKRPRARGRARPTPRAQGRTAKVAPRLEDALKNAVKKVIEIYLNTFSQGKSEDGGMGGRVSPTAAMEPSLPAPNPGGGGGGATGSPYSPCLSTA